MISSCPFFICIKNKSFIADADTTKFQFETLNAPNSGGRNNKSTKTLTTITQRYFRQTPIKCLQANISPPTNKIGKQLTFEEFDQMLNWNFVQAPVWLISNKTGYREMRGEWKLIKSSSTLINWTKRFREIRWLKYDSLVNKTYVDDNILKVKIDYIKNSRLWVFGYIKVCNINTSLW